MTIARARTAVCIVLAGLVASAVSVARASAATPAQRYPVGSAGMSLAVSIAERYWDADPCGGDVALSWATVDPSWVNARAYWSNPIGVSGHADANFACSVVFNANAWLPWPRFCSVVAHEVRPPDRALPQRRPERCDGGRHPHHTAGLRGRRRSGGHGPSSQPDGHRFPARPDARREPGHSRTDKQDAALIRTSDRAARALLRAYATFRDALKLAIVSRRPSRSATAASKPISSRARLTSRNRVGWPSGRELSHTVSPS